MGNGSNGVVSCAAVAEINSIPNPSSRLLRVYIQNKTSPMMMLNKFA